MKTTTSPGGLYTSLIVLLSWATPALGQAPEAAPAQEPATPVAQASDAQADDVHAGDAVTGAAPTDEQAALRAEVERQRAQLEAQERAIEELREQLSRRYGDGARRSAAADQAEVAQWLGQAEVSEYAAPEPLEIYGYMDMGFQKAWAQDDSFFHGLLPTRSTTFLFGNLNVYLDANPHVDWRGLAEVRFTNLPHGEEVGFAVPGATAYDRVDRTAADYTNPDGRETVILGSTIIERAWIQWQGHPRVKLRVGQWLAPFGIWNVDHGSPVLIALVQPDFQIAQAFPTTQLGVQALGEAPVGSWTLSYHAYVSNGRTFGQVDLSEDKALGGRLRLERFADLRLALGVSGYWGTFQDVEKEIASFEPLVIEDRRSVEAEEGALGADVALDAGAFRLRWETVFARVAYEEGKRPPVSFGPPGALAPDAYYWESYVIFAYRLPFAGLEPYLYLETTHRPSANGDTSLVGAPGLNVYFSPSTQLKTMVALVGFTDLVGEDTANKKRVEFVVWTTRLVLAF